MEGRRDSTGADMPSSPLFNHPPPPDLYMEELLQGLVNQSQSLQSDGQVGFQPWSTYGDEAGFNQSNFMGWNAFRPTLDLSSAARGSGSSHHSDLPAGSSSTFTACEDYLNSLSLPESDNSSEAGSGGFFCPTSSSHESLLGGQNMGAASDNGRHLYAEALNHWVNFTGKRYEPFGRPEVFHPPADSDVPPPEPACLDETRSGGTSPTPCCNSARPSYSDVARNQPVGSSSQPAITKSKTGANTPPCEFPDFSGFPMQGAPPHCPSSSHSRRHKVGSSSRLFPVQPSSFPGTDKPPATPGTKNNSRMGLDQFGDALRARERYKQQQNCEDVGSSQSRKGSASSVGIGSSGMEEPPYRTRTRTQSACSNVNHEDISTLGCKSNNSSDRPPITAPAKQPGTFGNRSPVIGIPTTNTHTAKPKSKIPYKTSRPRAASSPSPVPSNACGSSDTHTVSPLCPTSPSKPPTGSDSKKKQAFFDPKRIFDQKASNTPLGPNSKPGSSQTPPGELREMHIPVLEPEPVSTSGPMIPGAAGMTADCHIPNNQNHGPPHKEKGVGNLLNNGKAKSNLYSANNVHHTKPTTTHYINNDLRQPTKKQTNTEGRNSPNRSSNMSTNTPTPAEEPQTLPADPPSKEPPLDVRSPPVPPTATRRKQDHGCAKKTWSEPRPHHAKRSRRHREPSVSYNCELLMHVWEWCKWMCAELMQHAQGIFVLILKVTLALLAVGFSGILAGLGQLWQWLQIKIPYLRPKVDPEENESFDWSNPSSQSRFKAAGLEKNITLPTTGEEAMKRLLACKGKDPYSILGVRVDSPDEEIKKYYRKQAVLVHPDKNKIPGAEEAFKILGHAFDIIGEPEKRSQYDAQRHETQETETAMHEFADLLTKLRSKMQEAVNLMRCEKCGGRHRRVPVDRPWYNARFCDRCNVRHSAKEGDVWAESRVMGFLWHYYACMEGKIYDITEWASCQSGNFKHIQANAHHVIYRIATQAGARQRSQSSAGRSNSNEPDLEDFINQLFHRPGRTDGMPNPETPQQQQHPSTSTASSTTAAAAAAAKKRGRKKKKH